jgi:small subunit ribosomal protein S17
MAIPAVTTPETTTRRGQRKTRTGQVVSNKMQKTIVVRVVRRVRHRLYERVLRQATSFKVHDERNEAKVGDWVKIMETRPLSKDKRWRLVEILRRASTAPALPGEDAQPRHPSVHREQPPVEGATGEPGASGTVS